MIENNNDKLIKLRSAIDEIDLKIIDLINQRMEIVSKVSEVKTLNNEKFFIKSSREADMIKNLTQKVEGKFSKLTIINIWRKLITMANMKEQILKIGIHNPHGIAEYEYLIREYFSQDVSIVNFDSVTNLIAEIEKASINIGVFLLPNQNNDFDKNDPNKNNWWINIANNRIGLKIYSKIPFIEFANKTTKKDVQLVLSAIKEAEKSKSDYTLLSLEVTDKTSKSEIITLLKNLNITFKILSFIKNSQFEGFHFYLIEIYGFYLQEDITIKNMTQSKIKPFIKIIGHYPEPIILN